MTKTQQLGLGLLIFLFMTKPDNDKLNSNIDVIPADSLQQISTTTAIGRLPIGEVSMETR